MTLTTILVLVYCFVAAVFHFLIIKELDEDMELKQADTPYWVKMLVAAFTSMFWPIFVLIGIFGKDKEAT